VVDVNLDAQYEDLVDTGTTATVRLPDDRTVQAQVSTVGNATTQPAGQGGGDPTSTLPVELTIADQSGLGRYQAASVDVILSAETHQNVLAVPITALVARSGGGYAVEAVTAQGIQLVPVTLGMFSDSLVEVSGQGITEGLVVGVPK
jgi:hypothetical protein